VFISAHTTSAAAKRSARRFAIAVLDQTPGRRVSPGRRLGREERIVRCSSTSNASLGRRFARSTTAPGIEEAFDDFRQRGSSPGTQYVGAPSAGVRRPRGAAAAGRQSRARIEQMNLAAQN